MKVPGDPDATDSRRKAVQELIGKRGGKNSTFVLEAGGESGDLGDQWGEEAVCRGAQPRQQLGWGATAGYSPCWARKAARRFSPSRAVLSGVGKRRRNVPAPTAGVTFWNRH